MSKTEKEVVSIRVPQDTYEEFERYRNERGLTKTDAGRRLLERALTPGTQSEPQTIREDLKQTVRGKTVEWVLVMVVSIILSFVAPVQWIALASIAFAALGIVLAIAGLWFDVKEALSLSWASSDTNEVAD